MSSKQLYEKTSKGYNKIYPLAKMKDVFDDNNQINIIDTFKCYNHIYIGYTGDTKSTRLTVPEFLRRWGLWITYDKDGTFYTEAYIGTDVNSNLDEVWSKDSNWQYIPDIKYINDASLRIPNEAILPEHLSQSILDMIAKAGATIHNLVDEEDLTEKNCHVIKFKDREYNPAIASGKGYKILRKNWVGGKNILTQEMINDDNTRYIIQYDFDLDGKTIDIHNKNSIIEFQGGTIRNGILRCNKILGNGCTIYCPVEISASNAIVNNLIIDCQYKYDTALYIYSTLYSSFINISVCNYNKIGIYLGENCYECNLVNFECISRKSLTKYKYNIGVYIDCSDCYINNGVIKHNHIGMYFKQCNAHIVNNIHIWGEENNRTAIGIIGYFLISIFNNIYFDTIVGDKTKNPYELLDGNIDYSYNGGICLLIQEYSVNTKFTNVLALHNTKDKNENNISYLVGDLGIYDNNIKIDKVILSGKMTIDNLKYIDSHCKNYDNKTDITNVTISWNDDGLRKGKAPNIGTLKNKNNKGLNADIFLSDDDDTFDFVKARKYINGVIRSINNFNNDTIIKEYFNANNESIGTITINGDNFDFDKPIKYPFIKLNNISLNNIKNKGVYEFDANDNITDGPYYAPYNNCKLIVFSYDNVRQYLQLLICNYLVSYRICINGIWNDWVDVSLTKTHGTVDELLPNLCTIINGIDIME